MILKYLTSRLSLVKFFSLSLLFALFILQVESSFEDWILGAGFLLVSFLIFRIIDDIGSVHLDRINHPSRIYLLEKNISKMIIFGGFVLTLYIISLEIFMPSYFMETIGGFAVGSIIAYLVFDKNKILLPVIPILKYPLLLWCLTSFSIEVEHLLLVFSSAMIMGSHDTIEKIKSYSSIWFFISIILVLTAGLLIFQPWSKALNNLYILPIVILVAALWRWKYAVYFPILYFPIAYFISNNFLA